MTQYERHAAHAMPFQAQRALCQQNGEKRGKWPFFARIVVIPQYLNRRVSWWEARAERQADAALKKVATAESLENRQAIQQKARGGRRIHSLETKRLEKQRQLDQQRQEIHPEHVQVVLQTLAKEQATPPGRPAVSRLLAPAVPRADPPGTSIEHLPIRDLRGDDDDATF